MTKYQIKILNGLKNGDWIRYGTKGHCEYHHRILEDATMNALVATNQLCLIKTKSNTSDLYSFYLVHESNLPEPIASLSKDKHFISIVKLDEPLHTRIFRQLC